MVLQAAGLPSEHSSTSTSRQTFTLVEDQHLKNGDVDLLAPGMLIPETKLWHTPTIGTQPQHPPIVLYTPLCPQNVPAKQSSLDQDNRRLVKIWRILHFWLMKSVCQPAGCSLWRVYINLLAGILVDGYQPAGCSLCCTRAQRSSCCPAQSVAPGYSPPPGISSSDSGTFWDILGCHHLILGYSGNTSPLVVKLSAGIIAN